MSEPLEKAERAVREHRLYLEQIEQRFEEAETHNELVDVFRMLKSHYEGDRPDETAGWAYKMLKLHFERNGKWDESQNYPVIE